MTGAMQAVLVTDLSQIDVTQCFCANRLTNLQRLSVQSNRLTSMTGLEACTALQELYLSHNGISHLEVCMFEKCIGNYRLLLSLAC